MISLLGKITLDIILTRELKRSKAMAPHSSTLAWKIPWTEEPGGLHGVAKSRTQLSDFTFTFHFHALEKEGNGNPLQCSCLENPRDGGAW